MLGDRHTTWGNMCIVLQFWTLTSLPYSTCFLNGRSAVMYLFFQHSKCRRWWSTTSCRSVLFNLRPLLSYLTPENVKSLIISNRTYNCMLQLVLFCIILRSAIFFISVSFMYDTKVIHIVTCPIFFFARTTRYFWWHHWIVTPVRKYIWHIDTGTLAPTFYCTHTLIRTQGCKMFFF